MNYVVKYIQRKKCPPFLILRDVNRHNHWAIVDGTDSVVYYPSFVGNSKQRRQQRRKMLRMLNS
jgi:hypothetical protein